MLSTLKSNKESYQWNVSLKILRSDMKNTYLEPSTEIIFNINLQEGSNN